ncbi:MAG: methyltransferase domain-containing protein [Alphaproteobacteria bacterium]|nr:methyltransferase domain-containing protein [Alphaproteobacteria bacterium]
MPCTPQELVQKRRFEDVYERSQAPVMRSIERRVCGCDFGGNSWTTQTQADELIARLQLRPGTRLLDLGAGSGWPGLYFAAKSACDVVLVDLPETGLRIAEQRAARQGLSHLVSALVGDAAELSFADRCFDAVSHSDLLCCLVQKRSVLESCRRVIRPQGRMAFTVIAISPNLTTEQRRRAIAAGPEFIESETDYPTLLAETGWTITDHQDLTAAYAAACDRQIQADQDHAQDLAALIGPDQVAERMASWLRNVAALRDGLFRRELFVASPASA